jgi:hypothetical protein
VSALRNNTTAAFNTAVGHDALVNNNAGNNVAVGYAALYSNSTGSTNTANGNYALYSNTTGGGNTAVGFQALFNNVNTSIFGNTAVGYQALLNNTTSDQSSNALGYQALYSQTTGLYNNGFGFQALFNNVSGSNNVAIGDAAGYNVTGNGNVCIGAGVVGVAGENNATRIRNIYDSVASDRAVYVNSDDKLGTLASSRRFKEEIKPMNKASEALLGLKPVTFRYKQELDPHHVPMFGLIAEDVEKVNPDLVTRNKKGEVETVRYDAINAMLLNEFLKQHRAFLKEHRKVEQLEATVAQQQKDFQAAAAHQQGQIEALTAGLQRVSAQVEMSRPAPQMVLNNQ